MAVFNNTLSRKPIAVYGKRKGKVSSYVSGVTGKQESGWAKVFNKIKPDFGNEVSTEIVSKQVQTTINSKTDTQQTNENIIIKDKITPESTTNKDVVFNKSTSSPDKSKKVGIKKKITSKIKQKLGNILNKTQKTKKQKATASTNNTTKKKPFQIKIEEQSPGVKGSTISESPESIENTINNIEKSQIPKIGINIPEANHHTPKNSYPSINTLSTDKKTPISVVSNPSTGKRSINETISSLESLYNQMKSRSSKRVSLHLKSRISIPKYNHLHQSITPKLGNAFTESNLLQNNESPIIDFKNNKVLWPEVDYHKTNSSQWDFELEDEEFTEKISEKDTSKNEALFELQDESPSKKKSGFKNNENKKNHSTKSSKINKSTKGEHVHSTKITGTNNSKRNAKNTEIFGESDTIIGSDKDITHTQSPDKNNVPLNEKISLQKTRSENQLKRINVSRVELELKQYLHTSNTLTINHQSNSRVKQTLENKKRYTKSKKSNDDFKYFLNSKNSKKFKGSKNSVSTKKSQSSPVYVKDVEWVPTHQRGNSIINNDPADLKPKQYPFDPFGLEYDFSSKMQTPINHKLNAPKNTDPDLKDSNDWEIQNASSEDSDTGDFYMNVKSRKNELKRLKPPHSGPLVRSRAAKNIAYTYGTKNILGEKHSSSLLSNGNHSTTMVLKNATNSSNISSTSNLDVEEDSEEERLVWNNSRSDIHGGLSLFNKKHLSIEYNSSISTNIFSQESSFEKNRAIKICIDEIIEKLYVHKGSKKILKVFRRLLNYFKDLDFCKVLTWNSSSSNMFKAISSLIQTNDHSNKSTLELETESMVYLSFLIIIVSLRPKMGYQLIFEERALERAVDLLVSSYQNEIEKTSLSKPGDANEDFTNANTSFSFKELRTSVIEILAALGILNINFEPSIEFMALYLLHILTLELSPGAIVMSDLMKREMYASGCLSQTSDLVWNKWIPEWTLKISKVQDYCSLFSHKKKSDSLELEFRMLEMGLGVLEYGSLISLVDISESNSEFNNSANYTFDLQIVIPLLFSVISMNTKISVSHDNLHNQKIQQNSIDTNIQSKYKKPYINPKDMNSHITENLNSCPNLNSENENQNSLGGTGINKQNHYNGVPRTTPNLSESKPINTKKTTQVINDILLSALRLIVSIISSDSLYIEKISDKNQLDAICRIMTLPNLLETVFPLNKKFQYFEDESVYNEKNNTQIFETCSFGDDGGLHDINDYKKFISFQYHDILLLIVSIFIGIAETENDTIKIIGELNVSRLCSFDSRCANGCKCKISEKVIVLFCKTILCSKNKNLQKETFGSEKIVEINEGLDVEFEQNTENIKINGNDNSFNINTMESPAKRYVLDRKINKESSLNDRFTDENTSDISPLPQTRKESILQPPLDAEQNLNSENMEIHILYLLKILLKDCEENQNTIAKAFSRKDCMLLYDILKSI
ncbi:hypothetical protein BB559_004478 [Furculomyces boomerangus]|uniref:Uncharacterized protein n=1 Tax=Furculomyces boomerangus TaxID=61424 RepID=A0A2T9YEF8_9FUNG|nr:hypothetical protein BB559_004478 [Furculomyces boomerangus]